MLTFRGVINVTKFFTLSRINVTKSFRGLTAFFLQRAQFIRNPTSLQEIRFPDITPTEELSARLTDPCELLCNNQVDTDQMHYLKDYGVYDDDYRLYEEDYYHFSERCYGEDSNRKPSIWYLKKWRAKSRKDRTVKFQGDGGKGPGHCKVFSVTCTVTMPGEKIIGIGKGFRKKDAKRESVEAVFSQLDRLVPDWRYLN